MEIKVDKIIFDEVMNWASWKNFASCKLGYNITTDDNSYDQSRSNQTVNLSCEELIQHCSSGIKAKNIAFKSNYADISECWGVPLKLLDVLISFSSYIRENSLDKNKLRDGALDIVLPKIHRSGCVVASEVLTLMRNGFPDGAFARWRTLHELSVVMMFLKKKGSSAATRYMDWEVVQDAKDKKKYESTWKALGYSEPDDDFLVDSSAGVEMCIGKYGKEFKDEYGWATPYLNKKGKARVSFSDLENDVDHSRYRLHYSLSSGSIHAGMKGINNNLAMYYGGGTSLLSSCGFLEPGDATAGTLMKMNAALMPASKSNEEKKQLCVAYIIFEMIRESLRDGQMKAMEKSKQKG